MYPNLLSLSLSLSQKNSNVIHLVRTMRVISMYDVSDLNLYLNYFYGLTGKSLLEKEEAMDHNV